MEPVLAFENVSFSYEGSDTCVEILKDMNMAFFQGKTYAIVGPSGSGKTTTLALASALEEPTEGVIVYRGKDIKKIGHSAYRKKNIGIVFQSYNLIPYMTALENVLVGMSISGVSCEVPNRYALELLRVVGITEEQAHRKIGRLSGGQQQRVGIARALAKDADIILADEPTGNLDQKTAKEMVALFQMLAKEHRKTVIVVTHDEEIAASMDHAIKISEM